MTESEHLLNQAKEARGYTLAVAHSFDPDALLHVPTGARNNVLWNLGHVITDLCNMIYLPAGAPSPLPPEYNAWFDPGTSPSDWNETRPDPGTVVANLSKLGDQLKSDWRAGVFDSYTQYERDDGPPLLSKVDALAHCNLHEAYHHGLIAGLLKLIDLERDAR